MVTPHMNVYRLHVPVPDVGAAGHAVTSRLPSREQTLFYGGLGAAAVFGVLEWPVAAAVGIGTEIARRTTRARRAQPEEPTGKSGKKGKAA